MKSLIAVALLASAAAANAQPYIGILAGPTSALHTRSYDRRSDGTGNTAVGRARFKSSAAIDGVAGWQFNRHVRVEANALWMKSAGRDTYCVEFCNTKHVTDGRYDEKPVSGHASTAAAMANVLYDIRPSSRIWFSLGGGIGAAWIRYDLLTAPGGGVVPRQKAHDVDFTAQAIAEANVKLTSSTALVARYRYFDAPGVKVDTKSHSYPGAPRPGDSDHRFQAITFGLRLEL